MKKLLFTGLVTALSWITVAAQERDNNFHLEGGVRLVLPVGSLSKMVKTGMGVDLQGEYYFTDHLSATITTGYTVFRGKTVGSTKFDKIGYIPLMAGIRVYTNSHIFAGFRMGLGFLTNGISTSGFNYEPQLGYNLGNLQFALGYNGLSANGGSLNHLSLTGILKFN